MTYGIAAGWTPKFSGLPSMYNVLLGYNSESLVSYELDLRYLLGELTGLQPVKNENGNYRFNF